jgi:class 3 adenylate cyclase
MAEISLADVIEELKTAAKEALGNKLTFVETPELPAEEAVALDAPIWRQVNGVACLGLDMVNSSQIDYQTRRATSGKIYEAFTGRLIQLWRMFGAGFYDIKGDGGFALFDGTHATTRAFLAGETFRTAVNRELRPAVSDLTKGNVRLGTRTSISFGNVVVKRIGVKGRYNNNLVWLGSTVNQGMKILSKASGTESEEELVVTPAAFEQLTHDKIRLSCGCNAGGTRTALWTEVPTEDLAAIGIDRIYRLKSPTAKSSSVLSPPTAGSRWPQGNKWPATRFY